VENYIKNIGFMKRKFKKPKIGLALSAGGPRGLAHIGVLKVLEENGISIDCLAGTSIGSLIGSLYAAGVEIAKLEEIALNVDIKQTAVMLTPTISRSGLVDGKRMKEFIKLFVGDANIEDLKIPFAAVATDIKTGEEIVIDNGSVAEAVRASISIPGIFTPVRFGDRFLVDGGLSNPVPVSEVKQMGADVIIAVNVIASIERNAQRIGIGAEAKEISSIDKINSKIVNSRIAKYIQSKAKQSEIVTRISDIFGQDQADKKLPPLPSIFDVILQTITIMENEILTLRLKEDKPDILISPEVGFLKPLEYYRAKEAILAGERVTKDALPEIQQLFSKKRRFRWKRII